MTADEAIRDLTQSFQSVSLKPMNARPDVLYHYTSAQGLLGIITSGVLRAGNFSFFNDSSELTYGQDLVRDVVVEELGNVPNQLLQLMSLRLQHRLYAFSDEFDFYLCCFCEDADLLSQWRAYGSSGSRFF